jgi:hypothetical protein
VPIEKPSVDFNRNQGDRIARNPKQLQITQGQSAEIAEKVQKVKFVKCENSSGHVTCMARPMRKFKAFWKSI